MFKVSILKKTGMLTLFFFIWFSVGVNFNYAQEEDDLFKARRLYQQGDYEGAISSLNDFINKFKADAARKKNVAEAFYLLAKVYFTVGEDDKVDDNLERAFETYPNFISEETDLEFKDRVTKVRTEMGEKKTEQTEVATPLVEKKKAPEEKKVIAKPAKKKKKKFPVALVLIGTAVVGALLYFLVFKKKDDTPADTRVDIRGTWNIQWYSIPNDNGSNFEITFTGTKTSGTFLTQGGDTGTYTVSASNYLTFSYNLSTLVFTSQLYNATYMSGNWTYGSGGNYGTFTANKLGAVKVEKKKADQNSQPQQFIQNFKRNRY
jgi:tetratricopeptide (TPR) repeat protein